MIELGHYTLLASLLICSWGFVAGIIGGRNGSLAMQRSAVRSVHANFFLLLITSCSLSGLIFTDQFSVRYIASYSSRNLPFLYKLSVFWGGQEGSLLFWALSISMVSFIAVVFSKRHTPALVSYLSAFLLGIMAFFALLIFFTGNPFTLMDRQVLDGQGLNPLLQNWYMVIHPPTLFWGFAGLAVPFAFAMAALADNFRDKTWIQGAGNWALFSWIFLTIGITLGGRWAYEELGWGGYWAWDPVENASFLPWLTLTAFIHSIILWKQRGQLKLWSFILLVVSFELTIFGTFITRSGVLSSVHAFGNSSIGAFLMWFMILTGLFSLGWIFYRYRKFKPEARLESLASREAVFVLNNWILAIFTLAVFSGTVLPAVSEIVTGRKVSVDNSFYNQVSWPLGLTLLFITGICTILTWKKAYAREIRIPLGISLAAGLITCIISLLYGVREGISLAFYSVSAFVLAALVLKVFRKVVSVSRKEGINPAAAFLRTISLSNRLICSTLVHAGFVIVVVGIIGSSLYTREETFMVREGEVFQMEDYTLTFNGVKQDHDPIKDVVTAELEVIRNGSVIGLLEPQKHFHHNYEQPMTEIALYQTFFRDLYTILYGWDGEGNFSFRIIINPLVRFIWWGVALMSLAAAWRVLFLIFAKGR